MRFCIVVLIINLFFPLIPRAQPGKYSVANAHSHNDYENPLPFYTAYNVQFGSIEADIFLQNGELIVAHDTIELQRHRTLAEFYLKRLIRFVQTNRGFAYPD